MPARRLRALDAWHAALPRAEEAKEGAARRGFRQVQAKRLPRLTPRVAPRRGREPARSDRSLLVTTDWKLKTVPPTLLPVLARLRDDVAAVQLVNFSPKALEAARRQVAEAMPGVCLEAGVAPSGHEAPPPFPGRALKAVARAVASRLPHGGAWHTALPSLEGDRLRAVDAFAKRGVYEVLAFEAFCERHLDGDRAASIACPGRQWHTAVAHQVAARQGAWSATLQNAFMSAGHTYVAPTGDYVTAIDSWTRDLLVGRYQVPPETVHVVSTPRFDGHGGGRDSRESRDSVRERLGFGDGFVVLFAAQVGFDAEAERIMRALARLTGGRGQGQSRPIRAIAKLHPRTPESVAQRLETAAEAANPLHAVEVVASGSIDDLLLGADAVVTLFSNVGIEAVIMRRPLVVVKFGEASYSLPLDAYGFAPVATSEAELEAILASMARDGAYRERQLRMAEPFLAQNPIMVAGSSASTIADAIRANLGNSRS